MVTTHAAGPAMDRDNAEKKVQHRVCTIVIAGTYASYEAGESINKAVYYNLPTYET